MGGRSLIADMGHFFSGMRTVVPWVGVSLLPCRFAARAGTEAADQADEGR